jgi:hypothetical protein
MNFQAAIKQLDHFLKPKGFLRQKSTWNRCGPSGIEVIDLQKSRHTEEVTVNAGVLDEEVYAIVWEKVPPEFAGAPACTINVRIGDLTEGRKDTWWSLDTDHATAEISESIARHVLPFLERMRSRAEMAEFLAATTMKGRYPPPIISLAVLQGFLGRPQQGRLLLAELESRSTGTWKDRVSAVAKRLQTH